MYHVAFEEQTRDGADYRSLLAACRAVRWAFPDHRLAIIAGLDASSLRLCDVDAPGAPQRVVATITKRQSHAERVRVRSKSSRLERT